ncbi:hypothetical protein [Pandoravirus japonicus]|uniref:Uncharacterized protein n=1 Tax=Pandoravirus japonicus TaxID=2823154 RepID=A0A811BMJ5_9VIRU|nr:hypothetical protein [Pandoravirus japonicus]
MSPRAPPAARPPPLCTPPPSSRKSERPRGISLYCRVIGAGRHGLDALRIYFFLFFLFFFPTCCHVGTAVCWSPSRIPHLFLSSLFVRQENVRVLFFLLMGFVNGLGA